jgi:hypothetical protein
MPENVSGEESLLMFVVDVLRHDIEPLSSVLKLLNNDGCIGWRIFWPRDFGEDEVVQALQELIRRKWVKVLEHSPRLNELAPASDGINFASDRSNYWFLLTAEGRRAWEKWDPPTEDK